MATATAHVSIATTCWHCHTALELECRGPAGYLPYPSFFEFLCPQCGRKNDVKTTGTVVAVRVAGAGSRA